MCGVVYPVERARDLAGVDDMVSGDGAGADERGGTAVRRGHLHEEYRGGRVNQLGGESLEGPLDSLA